MLSSTEIKKVFILDTSALLTYIENEDGSDYVESLLVEAENGINDLYVSFISLTEVFYITMREKGKLLASDRINLIQSLAVKVQESDETINTNAGKLKARNSFKPLTNGQFPRYLRDDRDAEPQDGQPLAWLNKSALFLLVMLLVSIHSF